MYYALHSHCYAMHSQCTAPNHVYKDVDTGQVASDLVSCMRCNLLYRTTNPSPDSLKSPCFHRVFPYTLNRDLKLSSHNCYECTASTTAIRHIRGILSGLGVMMLRVTLKTRRKRTRNGLEAMAGKGVRRTRQKSRVDNLRIVFAFHGSYIL